MTHRSLLVRGWLVVLLGALLPSTAWAQPKAGTQGSKAPSAKGVEPKAADANVEAGSANAPASEAKTEAASAGREKTLSGTKSAGAVKGSVKEQENKEGEKSYTFEALELEGRLKSPQVLYFLRRVRAQFDPSGLGHRSFLRELADTRRHRAVR